jgi:tRNA(fMet)-specific endonuclease VapC
MEKFLLDTNVCVFFLKGKYGLNEQFKKVGLKNCCISEVTLAELKYGAECSDRTDENMRMVDDFANVITIVPIFNSLSIYAKEKARLRKTGKLIDDFDILIGTTAVANNLILVTENEKHLSRISKVKIENWIDRLRK